MNRTRRPLLAAVLVLGCFLAVGTGCQDRQAPAVAPPKGSGPLPAGTMPSAAPPTARFVKLEEVTEWYGKAWGAMAEFNLLDATGAVVDRRSWTVTADSSGVVEFPANAIDGDPKSLWHTPWQDPAGAPVPPHWFVVSLGAPVRITGFRYLPRQDGSDNGSFAKYRFFVSDDGIDWGSPVSEGDFASMGLPSSEKIVVFARQTENHPPVIAALAAQKSPMSQAVSMRVTATDADGDAVTYAATGLPPGLAIAAASGTIEGTPIAPGEYDVVVSAADGKGNPATAGLHWTVDPPTVETDAAKSGPDGARFVKLEALSEVNGKAWSSIAEIDLVGMDGIDLPRDKWTVSADSADTSDRPANAIDGNPATLWHSQWNGGSPPPPHSFVIDIGHREQLKALRVLPRQDGSANGVIARFRIYTSIDGVAWNKPVAEGDFTTMDGAKAAKTVSLR